MLGTDENLTLCVTMQAIRATAKWTSHAAQWPYHCSNNPSWRRLVNSNWVPWMIEYILFGHKALLSVDSNSTFQNTSMHDILNWDSEQLDAGMPSSEIRTMLHRAVAWFPDDRCCFRFVHAAHDQSQDASSAFTKKDNGLRIESEMACIVMVSYDVRLSHQTHRKQVHCWDVTSFRGFGVNVSVLPTVCNVNVGKIIWRSQRV